MTKQMVGALLLVACLGGCQGPEMLTFGNVCDVDVRGSSGDVGVVGGWARSDADFFIRPKRNAQWVTDQGNRILVLTKGQTYLVTVTADAGVVRIADTRGDVEQRPVSSLEGLQGIVVDQGRSEHGEIILWLIARGVASKIVIWEF